MIAIGVTGSVGTGKSTVSRMFKEMGAIVLDADETAHILMQPRRPVWRKIRACFGPSILAAGAAIDRRQLGALVFSDPKRLRLLCRIVHPAVRRRFQEELNEIRRKHPQAVVVLDIPLLLEAGPPYPVDATVVVSASPVAVARRLRARSGWSLEEVKRRQSFQMPLREKERRADFVVRNSGSVASTRRQVSRIWKRIKEKN